MIDQGNVAPASLPRPSAAPADASTGTRAAPGAEALAALSGAGKNRKSGASKATPAALEKTAPKGTRSFADLLKARETLKGGSHDAAADLKIPGPKPGAEKTPGLPTVQHAQAAASGGKVSSAAETAAKDDKAPARKKVPQTQAVTMAALAVLAPAPSNGPKAPAPREKAAAATSPSPDLKAAAARGPAAQREPVIHVVDLRNAAKHLPVDPAAASSSQPQAADKDFSAVLMSRSTPGHDAPPAPPPAAVPPSLPQAPLDRLRDMAGAELLKASNLVLKDGGGEIRLVLKPESLGSVRIRMNLVDNAIEGRIVVDSSSVKQVVDANMDALRRALTAQGFNPGALQVSVGGQGTDADARRQDQPAPEVRRVTSQAFERSVPPVEAMSLGDMLVNLFV